MPAAHTASPFLRPEAGQARDGQRVEHRMDAFGACTTVRPSGLSRSDAIFATSLFGATPIDAVSPHSSRICCLMRAAIVGAPSVQLQARRDVEEGLVDRQAFDQRRVARRRCANTCRETSR